MAAFTSQLQLRGHFCISWFGFGTFQLLSWPLPEEPDPNANQKYPYYRKEKLWITRGSSCVSLCWQHCQLCFRGNSPLISLHPIELFLIECILMVSRSITRLFMVALGIKDNQTVATDTRTGVLTDQAIGSDRSLKTCDSSWSVYFVPWEDLDFLNKICPYILYR